MTEQATYWVGIDVAKDKFDCALASPGLMPSAEALRALPTATFGNAEEEIAAFLKWVRARVPKNAPVRAVMEATGKYSLHLVEALCKKRSALAPAVANPHRTHSYLASLGIRNKTDALDARALAFYGLKNQPAAYDPLPPERARLRELSRLRDGLVRTLAMHKNQLQEQLSKASIQILKRVLKADEEAIEKTETLMKELIGSNENLRRDFSLLDSIKGVGFVTAAVTLAEVGDLRLFKSGRQVAAHAGVNPARKQSGKAERRPHMCKEGNVRMRQALYMAAVSAIRFNPHLREVYQRLTAAGKERMAALGAVMRKLIVLMHAIVVSGNPYDPMWKTHQEPPKIAAGTA